MTKLRALILLSLFCFTLPALALKVKVAIDGAAVYSRPDFDSTVLDYLSAGVQVLASHRLFTGPTGLGSFHRIKTPSGKFGYLADTDVILPKGAKTQAPAAHRNAKKLPPEEKRPEPRKRFEDEDMPEEYGIYLGRYIGGAISMIDYTEKFQGRKLHEYAPFLGLRMTGPGTLFDGPPLDFNILFSPRPPKYLGSFATGNATGFSLLGDLMIVLPLAERRNSLFNYGLGLMWTYSHYTVQVGNSSYAAKDLRIGLDFLFGYAYRFSRDYLLRADLKYYIEKQMYLGGTVSFQVKY